MSFEERFGTDSPLIGMVHLPALPGAPGYGGSREAIRAAALGDARALVEAAVGEEAAGSDAATEPPAENEPEVAGEPEAGGE